MRKTSLTAAIGAAALLALSAGASWAAGDGSVVPSAAKQPAAPSAVNKTQKCAETKKKISDYEAAAAAAPKGAKVSGAETIKSDMSWYKSNCS
ncbi:MAG: hypothetical protein U1F41_13365 [Burkholderiales bacterium]